MPSTHEAVPQSPGPIQVASTPQRRHVPPPQSTSDSAPFFVPSEQVGAAHTPLLHTMLRQSPGRLHGESDPHGPHVPPQSIPVSSPLATPSEHVGAGGPASAPAAASARLPA